MTPEIVLYTTPNCMGCRLTVRKLNKLGAPFRKIDLTEDDDAMNMVLDLGYKEAPVVMVGDEHWGGYSPDRLEWAAEYIAQAGNASDA